MKGAFTCCTDRGKDKSDLAGTCRPIGAFTIVNGPVSAFCPPPGPVLLQMEAAASEDPRIEVQIMQCQRVMKYDGFAQAVTPSLKSTTAVEEFSCSLGVAFRAGMRPSTRERS